MVAIVKCPTCQRPVEWVPESVYRPFCSDRCRLIDLGAWLTEKHAIPDSAADATADDELPPDGPPEH